MARVGVCRRSIHQLLIVHMCVAFPQAVQLTQILFAPLLRMFLGCCPSGQCVARKCTFVLL